MALTVTPLRVRNQRRQSEPKWPCRISAGIPSKGQAQARVVSSKKASLQLLLPFSMPRLFSTVARG